MRRAILILILAALCLPMLLTMFLGLAALLEAMQDVAGGEFLRRLALASGVLWAVSLVGLVLLVAVQTLLQAPGPGLRSERPDDAFLADEEEESSR